MNFLTKDVAGGISPLDAVLVAGSKVGSQFLLRPILGDGTLMSGLLKMGGALVLTGAVKGKFGSIVGTGLMVDGGEDIVASLMGGSTSKQSAKASTVGGGVSSPNQGVGLGAVI